MSELDTQLSTQASSSTEQHALRQMERIVSLVGAENGAAEQLATGPAAASNQTSKILIADDQLLTAKAVIKYLKMGGYENFEYTTNPSAIIPTVQRYCPDLLLLDLVMPGSDGLEILRALRQVEAAAKMPVIILTAVDDPRVKAQAFNLGATDFLTKPVDATELLARVKNVLAAKSYYDHLTNYAAQLEQQVQARTAELEASRMDIIHCLARAVEYRDNETGRHVVRVGLYVGIIARQLGLPPSTVRLLEQAAPLHDMGKIGIPDEILLKPGKLGPDEMEVIEKHCGFGKKICEGFSRSDWQVIAKHTSIGAEILEIGSSPLLRMAASLALTHHEKWDGSGYPLGLAGEDIPLEGRITAVADVFDALSTKRPYKPAMPADRCFQIMDEQRGKHFDPNVLDAFFARRAEIVKVQIEYADVD